MGGQNAAVPGTVDVGALIDAAPLSRYQMMILCLCGAVAILDGIDTFSMGIAAPSIAAGLGMRVTEFGPVFSAALFGATLGAFGFGPMADRFGRKTMLVAAVGLFGLFTLLTAFAWSYGSLLAIRFGSGIGLGGATPCFLALASEYVPGRMRARVTAALWSGFPLGGMIGGFLNSWLVHAFDWQAMFYVGGVAPLVVAMLVAIAVPESVRYLLAAGAAPARVESILARLAPGSTRGRLPLVAVQPRPSGVAATQLFTQGRGWATVLLWVPFFMAFGVLAIVVLWTPALLREAGMSASGAAIVVGFHGLGGFIGMAAAGVLLERFGPKVLVPAFLVGAVLTAALGSVGTSVPLASLCDGLIGVFVGIGASGMIAFGALVYPTAIRSTGIGWAMGMGRLGQVAAPLITGALLLAGWSVEQVFIGIAAGPVLAAVFVPLVARTFGSAGGRAYTPLLPRSAP